MRITKWAKRTRYQDTVLYSPSMGLERKKVVVDIKRDNDKSVFMKKKLEGRHGCRLWCLLMATVH
jgi:hypothetical protein